MNWIRLGFTVQTVIIFSMVCALAAPSNTPHLYRISLKEQSSTVPLVEAGVDILAAIPRDYALAELTQEQMTHVIHLGYAVQYLASSLDEFSAADETDGYYNYTTLTAQLQAWASEYANIAVLHNLGTSWGGRTIWGMKVSDNPQLDEDEIACLVCGCHHGNERISAEVPMYFLNYLLSHYGVDPDVTYYVDNREIWVIPVVNPDGYTYNNRLNTHHVDINRNYSFHWGEWAVQYGPYPFSEPETQAVRDLNLTHHITLGHSYHSFGDDILYPFAWRYNHPTPDSAFFSSLVAAMVAFNHYTPMLSGNLYPHGGEMNDYLYAEQGAFSVTSEVYGGPSYNPPYTGIVAVCRENLPTDLYELQRAGEAQITGRITDSVTGAPLVAQYKVMELWNPNEIYPWYSEPRFGRYRHLVQPGTYTLEISKAGYATQTIPNIVVSGPTPTVRDVHLVFTGYLNVDQAHRPINVSSVKQSAGFTLNGAAPNPFNPTTAINYELRVASYVNLRVYDTAGRLVNALVDGWQEAGTHQANFDGSGLAAGVYLYTLTVGNHTATGKMVMLK